MRPGDGARRQRLRHRAQLNVLFCDAGINLSYLGWCHLTGAPVPEVRQRDGVAWVSLASDCTSFWQRWRGGSLGAGQWLNSLVAARSFSWFEAGDPEPAIGAALRLPVKGLRVAAGLA